MLAMILTYIEIIHYLKGFKWLLSQSQRVRNNFLDYLRIDIYIYIELCFSYDTVYYLKVRSCCERNQLERKKSRIKESKVSAANVPFIKGDELFET